MVRMLLALACASLLMSSAALSADGYDQSLGENDVNRVGGDYAPATDISPGGIVGPQFTCAQKCLADARCKAWTVVKPGIQGPQSKCWLKDIIPPPTADNCCISGVPFRDVEIDINRVGTDYKNYDLPIADFNSCKAACDNDSTKCRAWTYVKPGVQGRNARCWLKQNIPPAAVDKCCVSGANLGGSPPVMSSQQQFSLLSRAFQNWIGNNRIVNAALSNGESSLGYGSRNANDPYPIASLSKAITATCVAHLIATGSGLSYTDKIQTRLPKFVTSHKFADGRASLITIEQLLRHTSGMITDNDPTRAPWRFAIPIPNSAPADTAAAAEIFAAAQLVGNPLGKAPGSTPYSYVNVNYALLGMVIEQMSGQGYEQYCKQAVLIPGGLGAPTVRVANPALGAFGGWQMSAKQYADFISFNYRKLNPSQEAFMQASYATGYGLGVQVLKTSRGRHIWHTGNWPGILPSGVTRPSPRPPRETTRAMTLPEFSGYFALWDNGTLIVALMDKTLTDDQFKSLDQTFIDVLGLPPANP